MLQKGNIFANRYRIESRLGTGGFGEVWKVLDQVTNNHMAIKVHHIENGERVAKDIVHEYTRVMSIHHDNLLTPSHVDVADGNVPYLVMELCECDLTERDLNEEELWSLIRDLSSGLKRLAENKKKRTRSDGSVVEVSDPIIHQDIKPSNILLRSNGMWAISDFGISKRRLSTLSTNEITDNQDIDSGMSVDYAAPERFPRGKGVAVLASDIWSLGATLYEVVEGHRPFAECGGDCLNPTIGLKIPKITREGYSEELKKIIYRCMAKNPDDRPTATQLLDYAKKVLQGEQKTTIKKTKQSNTISEDSLLINKPKPNKYNNLFMVLLSCLCVLLVIVAFTLNNQKQQVQEQYGRLKTEIDENKEEQGYVRDVEVDLVEVGKCRYTGEVDSTGCPNGMGMAVFSNGDTYIGLIEQGNFQSGHYTWAHQDFDGHFINNKQPDYNSGTFRTNLFVE